MTFLLQLKESIPIKKVPTQRELYLIVDLVLMHLLMTCTELQPSFELQLCLFQYIIKDCHLGHANFFYNYEEQLHASEGLALNHCNG